MATSLEVKYNTAVNTRHGYVLPVDSMEQREQTSSSEETLDDQINRIWKENRQRHRESERKLLYPCGESM